MKTCLKCGANKPHSEYHAKRGKPQPQCKACRSEYMRGHYQRNKERVNGANKAWYRKNKLAVSEKNKADYRKNPEKYKFFRLRRKYGMSKTQYEEKLKEQDNKCAICFISFDEAEPHVDHCHEKNIFRGILCSNCNTGFGLFKENEAIFISAIAYRKKYKK